VHNNICDRFFAIAGMSDTITSLANFPYPLRRDGLAFCLRTAHAIGLNCVTEELAKASPALGSIGPPTQPVDAVNLIASVTTALKVLTKNEEGLDPAAFQTALFVGDLLHRQVELIKHSQADSEEARKWLALIQGFPVTYIAQLDRLVYSDWWVACFVANPTHAAMWGHYGDSHRGVCLKFRSFDTENGTSAIKLQAIAGSYANAQGSGLNYGDRQLNFTEMQYVPKFVEVDFFRSIGALPIPTLRDEWYSAEDGTLSSSDNFTNEEQWRHNY
jgi:hypothetical protein